MNSSIPVFSRLEMPGAQLIVLCRNVLAVRCQDGRSTVVCKQPPATSHGALANSLIWARCLFPLSVCLFVYVCLAWLCFCIFIFCMSLLWALLTLAVRYILTLWYGISRKREWEDKETAGGEENTRRIDGEERGGEERRNEGETPQRWEKMCGCNVCVSAWDGYSSISLRFSTFPLP